MLQNILKYKKIRKLLRIFYYFCFFSLRAITDTQITDAIKTKAIIKTTIIILLFPSFSLPPLTSVEESVLVSVFTSTFVSITLSVDVSVFGVSGYTGVKVGANAQVLDTVLMPNVIVEEGAVINRALIADGVHIGKGAVVGIADSEHIELVANDVEGVE